MALTEIYVNPALNSDTGTGTDVDPFGDLEYAIEQTTFDATNGTRVNIKTGTDEVLAAQLGAAMDDVVTSIAWVPTQSAELVFQGYSSTAGDLVGTGTTAGISGGGSVAIFDDNTKDFISFVDLHLHNVGANFIVEINNSCAAIRCELDNGTGTAAWSADTAATVSECYIHDFAGQGIVGTNGAVLNCYFGNGITNKFTTAIVMSSGGTIRRNIIKLDGSSDGMTMNNSVVAEHNSVWSDGGTGQGIVGVATRRVISCSNNIVEGFSGAGGIGFDFDAVNSNFVIYAGNAAYNNETNYSAPARDDISGLNDNEVLASTAFTSASTGDFSPLDRGNVKEGGLPAIIGGGLV